MRAVLIQGPGGPEVLKLGEAPDPVPDPGQVLIRVAATALNRADLLQRRGVYPPPPGVNPAIPGLECSGVVESSRDPLKRFDPGDRVMALLPGAGYAEYVAIEADLVMPVPDGLDLIQAAAVPETFLTAYDALFLQLGVSVGETVLIHAVGSGVGTAAVQMLRRAGARTVGTSRTEEKLRQSSNLGLDHGIQVESGDWVEAVMAFTGGRGVDAILDLAGAAYLAGNLDVLAPGGRMIVVGTLSGRRGEIDLGRVLQKRLSIKGTNLRQRSAAQKAELVARFRSAMSSGLADGSLSPVIDTVIPWEDAALAHARMESNRTFGKLVLSLPA